MLMKSKSTLLVLLGVLAMAQISSAGWLWWTNDAGNNQWTDSGNWTAYPTSGDDVVIGKTFSTGPVLNAGQTASANWMHLTDLTDTGSKLTVNGGTVNVESHLFVGQWDAGSKGTLEINSGAVNTTLLMVGGCGGDGSQYAACHGDVLVNGGVINVSWLLAIGGGYSGYSTLGSGHVQLDGGIINVTGGGGIVMSSTGSIDITDGALILNGEITNIASYGNVTAFGGQGSFVYNYADGRTTITAIPEPATLLFIGLRTLVLRKKSR
jgi:hypothetical protein